MFDIQAGAQADWDELMLNFVSFHKKTVDSVVLAIGRWDIVQIGEKYGLAFGGFDPQTPYTTEHSCRLSFVMHENPM